MLSALRQQGVIGRWEEGIDRYHLLERLAATLELLEPVATERSRQLTEWNERLDAQDSAIDSIERHLESHYAALPPAKQNQLWEHMVYIANNKDRMRYVTLSSCNLPIGSGVQKAPPRPSSDAERRIAVSVGASPDSAGQDYAIPSLAPAPGPERNLALGRPSYQSTTLNGAVAARANDGNADGNYWDSSVSHTDSGWFYLSSTDWPGQYWYVDLGAEQTVDAVNIFNRTDCCSERLSHYNILGYDSSVGIWKVISNHAADDTAGFEDGIFVSVPRHFDAAVFVAESKSFIVLCTSGSSVTVGPGSPSS